MDTIKRTPEALTRSVGMGYPAAIQAIAALETRLAYLQTTDQQWAAADCHAALAAIREAFGLWPRPEALDTSTVWHEYLDR